MASVGRLSKASDLPRSAVAAFSLHPDCIYNQKLGEGGAEKALYVPKGLFPPSPSLKHRETRKTVQENGDMKNENGDMKTVT